MQGASFRSSLPNDAIEVLICKAICTHTIFFALFVLWSLKLSFLRIGRIWDSYRVICFCILGIAGYFFLLFGAHCVDLILLNGTSCIIEQICLRLLLFWFTCKDQVDSDQEKEVISVEKRGRQKQSRSSKSTSLSVEALPKKQMSKEEKIRATKLRKEVSVFLFCFSILCSRTY